MNIQERSHGIFIDVESLLICINGKIKLNNMYSFAEVNTKDTVTKEMLKDPDMAEACLDMLSAKELFIMYQDIISEYMLKNTEQINKVLDIMKKLKISMITIN